ncbi:RDD family protein [Kitasatospora sp. NPDC002040]|uniref:RDD family protein n=1 Tax=Kitasatospora sp. NPDC002040 TaxID=3154661 RepID=UPI0033178353
MSTHDPSSDPTSEGGDKPSFDKRPPQPGAPQGVPSDPYGAPPPPPPAADPYGTPPPGGPYGAPGGYDGSPYGAPPPPPAYGAPYQAGAGPVPGMPPLGGWGARILARLIDFLLIQAVAVVVVLPFANLGDQGGWVGAAWLGYGLYFIYEGIMLSRDGQTFGKKLMKVRVAMLVDGSAPTGSAAWTRAATFVLPAVICCGGLWWPVNGLFGVFDKPYRQCIHDKAAKTVVVSTV